jgi:hypothetical protein
MAKAAARPPAPRTPAADTPAAAFALEVGGGRLVVAPLEQLAVEQDGWITAKLERAGLADPGLQQLAPADRQREVRLRILESGEIAGLLAGFLVAEGQSWSADAARRHQQLLRGAGLTGERALMHAMVEGLVQGFFARGPAGVPATGGPSTPAAEGSSLPSSAASPSGTGTPLSAPSPATTPPPSDGS